VRMLKFDLERHGTTWFLAPADAVAMSVGVEPISDAPVVWMHCEEAREPAWRRFFVAWTGEALPEHCVSSRLVGTVRGARYVWHVFDLGGGVPPEVLCRDA